MNTNMNLYLAKECIFWHTLLSFFQREMPPTDIKRQECSLCSSRLELGTAFDGAALITASH